MGTQSRPPTKMGTQDGPAEMGTQAPALRGWDPIRPEGSKKGTQPDLAYGTRTLLGKGLATLAAAGI
jgi:hypothetical protein